jgi:predicted ATPase
METKIFETEEELRGAREVEERTKKELDAALLDAKSAYVAVERVSGRLAQVRTDLQRARERREVFTRGLKDLEEATSDGVNTFLASVAHRATQNARRLEVIARKRTKWSLKPPMSNTDASPESLKTSAM